MVLFSAEGKIAIKQRTNAKKKYVRRSPEYEFLKKFPSICPALLQGLLGSLLRQAMLPSQPAAAPLILGSRLLCSPDAGEQKRRLRRESNPRRHIHESDYALLRHLAPEIRKYEYTRVINMNLKVYYVTENLETNNSEHKQRKVYGEEQIKFQISK